MATMKAWLLNEVSDLSKEKQPLVLADVPKPTPRPHEVLIHIRCCGICHTELDEIEGRTPPPVYPVIPGHQVVGTVETNGIDARRYREGDRVGVAWIFSSCGECEYCRGGRENLCMGFRATGRDNHGGYAQYMVVDENFVYHIPALFSDVEAAPLLCAGAIGYRSLMLAGLSDGQLLGLTGFGSSGHLVLKMARYLYPQSRIYVFARSKQEQDFARDLGASWASDPSELSPEGLHAIIDTTPAWAPVVSSLRNLRPGGRLVINAIRKESNDQQALVNLNYRDHLWMEKEIKSVANITRSDVEEFLTLASSIPIRPETQTYTFDQANTALMDLKRGHVRGAKVLICDVSSVSLSTVR